MKCHETSVNIPDGTRLKVIVFEADAPPSAQRTIILLHGWPNSGRVWKEFATAMVLADPSFRLIAPTFRGYGNSDHPATGYSNPVFADDVLAIVGAFNIRDYALVGHSMGGKVAQAVAIRNPEGLRQLVLLSPALATAAQVPVDKRESQNAVYGDMEKTRAMITGMTAHAPTGEYMTMLLSDATQLSKTAFVEWIETMREEDFANELSSIRVPTLVLHGLKDPLRTSDVLRSGVVERIGGAIMENLPGVGHLAHIEDPTLLAMAVVNFLDGSH